jgi:3'(2'), 5'-bisphosphate nucleotidase
MLETIQQIAREAGVEILKHYGRTFTVEAKADDSPLTQADRAAHALICRRLRELDAGLPVLSEESDEAEIRDRKSWRSFWLVDPLDGTKEFIKQTGEFTVNIALIEDGVPAMGVIHVPALDRTYYAEAGQGAWKRNGGGAPASIRVRPAEEGHLAIVASRDHAGPEVKALLERFPAAKAKSMGSSLKFCLVAEGEADLYLRDVPTMEWDVGAAQCIVEAAGGQVLTLENAPLRYNKDSLRNPALLTAGDSALAARVLDSLN